MLDKAIQYGKEKRKPYRKGKRWSKHCRNNNYCNWCRDNRLIQTYKALASAEDSFVEYQVSALCLKRSRGIEPDDE